MEQSNQVTIEKTFSVSRKITWFCFAFFIASGLVAFIAQNFDQPWLKSIYPSMFGISMVLVAFSWFMPGVFVLFGVPWHARAWLKGSISWRIAIKPWEEYSRTEVFATYFWSIFYLGFTVLGIISFVLNTHPK